MDAKGVMNSDLETLEEKLQILRTKMSEEEYETIRREIDEIRKLGLDLPDSGYMANVTDIIKRLVDLEVDSFSDKELKKTIKEVKKEGFLAKLEYVKLCAKEGKDVSQIFSVVGQYWDAIKGTFDAFEVSEVERKLEEVKLEILLKKVQVSREVKLNETEGVNYLLIRERLQDLLANETISQENKLLIKSWIGESIDAETGKVDAEFIKKLLVNKEIWEVLSGVKGVEVKTNQERHTAKTTEEAQESKSIQALIALGESKRRAEQIAKLSEKYHIPLKKFDLHKMQWDMPLYDYAIYILRYKRFGKTKYKWIGEIEASMLRQAKIKRLETKRPLNKEVVAVVFNNHVTEILEGGHSYQSALEEVVFPDALQQIDDRAFMNTRISEITIPGTVKNIGDWAFYNSSLQKISLEEGIQAIGTGAFATCQIKEINIPSSVKRIGAAAFRTNVFLKKLILNTGLREIGREAFADTDLQNVDFPETMQKVGQKAFLGNPTEFVSIPKGMKYESDTFSKGTRITERATAKGNEKAEESEEIERLKNEIEKLREENHELKERISEFEKLVKGQNNERESQSMEK